jgi:hypothetical protein
MLCRGSHDVNFGRRLELEKLHFRNSFMVPSIGVITHSHTCNQKYQNPGTEVLYLPPPMAVIVAAKRAKEGSPP